MFKRQPKFILFVVGACVILSLQGCDQISKFFDNFSSKKPTTTAKPQTPPSPVVEPVKTPSPSPAPSAAVPQPPAPQKEMPKNLLAKVGTWTLSLEEFRDRLNALKEVVKEYDIKNVEQNKLILEELIRQQLIVQDAEQQGIDKNKDIIQAVEEFRRTLLVREVATKLVEGIAATDQDAEDYYTQNQSEFIEPMEWRISQIVVDTEEEAKSILAQILQGGSFSEMVSTKSKKKAAKGFIKEFEFPKMADVVSALDVGGVSSVFKGPDGTCYIVKLEERKGGKPQPLAQIKEDLKKALTALKQQQAVLSYLDELRKKTTIEVNDKLLEE